MGGTILGPELPREGGGEKQGAFCSPKARLAYAIAPLPHLAQQWDPVSTAAGGTKRRGANKSVWRDWHIAWSVPLPILFSPPTFAASSPPCPPEAAPGPFGHQQTFPSCKWTPTGRLLGPGDLKIIKEK